VRLQPAPPVKIESIPAVLEQWASGFPGGAIHVAVEAYAAWLFVWRALERCGAIVHLAEPVETSALRGRTRRAKIARTGRRAHELDPVDPRDAVSPGIVAAPDDLRTPAGRESSPARACRSTRTSGSLWRWR
jgi:hypothetical protein